MSGKEKDKEDPAAKLPTVEAVAELIAEAKAAGVPVGPEEYEAFAAYRLRIEELELFNKHGQAQAFQHTGDIRSEPPGAALKRQRYAELRRVVGDGGNLLHGEYMEYGYLPETAALFIAQEIPPSFVAYTINGELRKEVANAKRRAARAEAKGDK